MANIDTSKLVHYSNEELMDVAEHALHEALVESQDLSGSTAHAQAVINGYTKVGQLALDIIRARDLGYEGTTKPAE